MFVFRSVKSIVIAPARTGEDRSKRRAVISTAQVNRVMLAGFAGAPCLLKPVVRKLIAPRIDLAPARWRAKIERSTAPPL